MTGRTACQSTPARMCTFERLRRQFGQAQSTSRSDMHRPIGRPRRPERARPAFQRGVKKPFLSLLLEPVMGYLLAIGVVLFVADMAFFGVMTSRRVRRRPVR